MEQSTRSEAAIVADLNDLLQLDHDAVSAYTVAIDHVQNPSYRDALHQFRGDHERHIAELTPLIRAHGGVPIELPHVPTGAFKLAVQAIGATGDDLTLLMAFKANERQVRDKYRRAAEALNLVEVTTVVRRAADDEARHYAWCLEALDDLGFRADSATGRGERAFEVAHKGVADATEAVERTAMEGAGILRRTAKRATRTTAGKVTTAVVAAAGGALLWRTLRGSRS